MTKGDREKPRLWWFRLSYSCGQDKWSKDVFGGVYPKEIRKYSTYIAFHLKYKLLSCSSSSVKWTQTEMEEAFWGRVCFNKEGLSWLCPKIIKCERRCFCCSWYVSRTNNETSRSTFIVKGNLQNQWGVN